MISLMALVEGAEPPSGRADASCASGTCTCTWATSRRRSRFWRDLIGFEVMTRFPSAAFISAGGYHHHLGLNTWRGEGVPPMPEGSVGMRHWTIVLDPTAVAAVRAAGGGGRRPGGGSPGRVPPARPVAQRRPDPLVIAVTGATGAVGGRVAAGLAELGVTQRLVVRDLAGSVASGCRGRGRGQLCRRRRDAARPRGCRHRLLRLRARGPQPRRPPPRRRRRRGGRRRRADRLHVLRGRRADTVFTFGRDHFHTEEHIKASPLRWTFLRDNIYLDFMPFFAGEDGAIRGPAADGRAAVVARDDIAASAWPCSPATATAARSTR